MSVQAAALIQAATVAAWAVTAAVAADDGYEPRADAAAIVTVGNARFTVLTPRLIRMEWSPDGVFEDRASFAFVNRKLPVPPFERSADGRRTRIKTDAIELSYVNSGEPFNPTNLSVVLESRPNAALLWVPGACGPENLGGTTRTLDGVSGACRLDDGILTRAGYTLIDDSDRLLFDENGWAAPRRHQLPLAKPDREPDAPLAKAIDWYFFKYGTDYRAALHDFTAVAGRIPLPPRYVFGAWWSRYWAYSDAELRELVTDFDRHDVPLDVLVVDMDWHLDGWTGYTWNPKYFPDPDGFLAWCTERGLRVTLNLHPADGVGRHERQFAEFCNALGLDPAATERVPFDCADPRYMDAYFRLLHHPEERRGVDFWWIDWQQGRQSKLPGLDPLFWLNHLHWRDMAARADETGRRPLIFSRWGGLGNHRYQIGFSGDTFCDWRSLAFQPHFTSTAGNVGYAFWSHDIGGHQPGRVDPELYARWIQWGALSPCLRTHTTKNPEAERRIWQFPPDVFEAARRAFHLRYALLPYIYTMARKTYDEALPLCRPLYYHWPEEEEAYQRPGQYLFGDDLLAAPVTTVADPLSGCASVEVWIPPGEWVNWFTGRTYRGPASAWLLVPLDEIPLFARAGAVIPAQPPMRRSDEKPLDLLVLHVWPGERGQADVYEDDGIGPHYAAGQCTRTPISNSRRGAEQVLFIGQRRGEFAGMVAERGYEIRFHDIAPPREVRLNGEVLRRGATPGAGWHYDAQQLALVVRIPPGDPRQATEVVVQRGAATDLDGWLAAGLRGQWNQLEYVWDRNGTLKPVERAAQADDFAVMRDARAVVEEWAAQPGAVQARDDAGPERQRRVLRLLGLAFDVRIHAPADGQAAPDAEVLLVATHGLPAMPQLAGQITLATAESPGGEQVIEFDRLQPGIPFSRTVGLPGGADRRTIHVRGSLRVRTGDTDVVLPFERTILPSVNAWWIAGPFDAPFESGLATVFPPESGFDPRAAFEGKGGKAVGWRRCERPVRPGDSLTDEFFVHLHEFYGERISHAVAYGFTYLLAPREQDASLAIGSDDGVAVWLNGKEVHRKNVGRPYSPKQDRVAVRLRKGANELLIKVNQGGGDWGFSVFVETPEGAPLPEVVAALEPAGP